jgi:hypothetical protein
MLHRQAPIERDRRDPPQDHAPIPVAAKETGPLSHGRPGHGWTVVLRRQPARIVDGRPEGGYTGVFELICCDCGDDPDLDYREAAPRFQRIRGPYPLPAGIAAYQKHVARQHQPQATHRPARPPPISPLADEVYRRSPD